MAAADPIVPAANHPVDLHINDPVHFIASQHQGTCFTDSIETILCYADTVRHVFLGEFLKWLTQSKLRLMTPTDPEFDGFVHSYVSARVFRPSPSVVNYVKSMFLRYTLRQFQQQEERLLRTAGLPVSSSRYPTSSKTLKRSASLGPSANKVKQYAEEILCSTGTRIPQVELFHIVRSLLRPYITIEDILRVGLAQTLNLFQSNKLLAVNISMAGSTRRGHAINLFRNNGVFYLGDNEHGIAEPISTMAVTLILNVLAIPNKPTCASAIVYECYNHVFYLGILQNGVYINLLRVATPIAGTKSGYFTMKNYPGQTLVFYESDYDVGPYRSNEPPVSVAMSAAAELARLPPPVSVAMSANTKAPTRSRRSKRTTRRAH